MFVQQLSVTDLHKVQGMILFLFIKFAISAVSKAISTQDISRIQEMMGKIIFILSFQYENYKSRQSMTLVNFVIW